MFCLNQMNRQAFESAQTSCARGELPEALRHPIFISSALHPASVVTWSVSLGFKAFENHLAGSIDVGFCRRPVRNGNSHARPTMPDCSTNPTSAVFLHCPYYASREFGLVAPRWRRKVD